MNKEDIEKLQQKFKNITETSKKYAEKGYVKSNNIDYRDPKDEEEELFINRVNKKTFILLLIITIILFATFVSAFAFKTGISIIIVLGLMLTISSYLMVKSKINKELYIGKVVYKERSRKSGSKKRVYNYYVSVSNDITKEIYTRIRISKNEYDIVEEGTTVLVSKGSSRAFIYEK